MKTMILKELKWNLKWALIAGTAWALCLAGHAMNWYFDPTSVYENLLSFNAQAVTFVGFPAFGLLLGFLQIFFESRRDSWAFLVHRPLSRRGIVCSKAIAGLILYFAAILIPSALFLLWLLQPGGLPIPFEWRVLLPALSDLLTGMVYYYFAGLLVGLRQARWHGSRLWPILAAALVSCLLLIMGTWPRNRLGDCLAPMALPSIWLLTFGISIALPLAAYGAFMTGGAFSRQPRMSKSALALILIIAGAAFFAFCWLFLVVSVVGIMNMLQHRLESPPIFHDMVLRYPAKTRSSTLAVTKDGRVVSVVSEQTNPTGKQPQGDPRLAPITAILDESGKPMEEFKKYIGRTFFPGMSSSPLSCFQAETLYIEYLRPSPDRENGHPRSFGYRQQPFYLQHGAQEKDAHWFYYPKRGLFFGYLRMGELASVSYRPLGSCGRNGFQLPTAPHAIPFDPPIIEGVPYGVSQYYTQSEVYRIDFQTREVKRVLSLPQGESIAAIASPPRVPQSPNEMPFYRELSVMLLKEREKDVYVLTNKERLLFVHCDNGVLAEINLAGVPFQIDSLNVGCVPDKQLFFVQTRDELLKYSQAGKLLARFPRPDGPKPLPYSPNYHFFFHLPDLDSRWETAQYYWKNLVLPVAYPPLCCFAANAVSNADSFKEAISLMGDGARMYPRVQTWRESGPSLVGALLALLFCNRRLRKYPFSRSEKIAWRLLTLLMGPGALLALYALYDWPAKEPCPACGKKRVVNRERCEFCGAPFTPPAPTGKEIFEKDEVGSAKDEG